MAWIELHQSLPTHRKTLKLKKLLAVETAAAIGHICCLWLWALDNAPDGFINDVAADDLAAIMFYKGDPENLLKALIEAGFVDENGRLHDWDDYAGKLIERRNYETERKRNYREQRRKQTDAKQAGDRDVPRDKTRDVTAINNNSAAGTSCRTVQYSTVQYQSNTPPYSNTNNGELAETDSVLQDVSFVGRASTMTPDQERTLRECSDAYNRIFGRDMSSITTEDVITRIRAGFDSSVIIDAMAKTKDRGKGQAYFLAILRNRALEGVKTKADLDASRSKGKVKAQEQTDYSDPERYKNMDLCGIREARDDEFA